MTTPDEPKRLLSADDLPASPRDVDEDYEPDECPSGGEHEPHEVRAANARAPLMVLCTKCRQPLERK